MRYRSLGCTGLQVSEIGYGAWGIGARQWIGAEDAQSLAALHAARDAGVNFFDTALAYGEGHSERLLARAFGASPEVIIASKVPPKNLIWPARPQSTLAEVFPRAHVLACLENSLRNLGRERLDLFQFHVWNDAWADDPEWLATVDEIKAAGKVRCIGISINDHQPANSLRALASGRIQVVQVIYNLFDQSPDDELFPVCAARSIGVIARVPFDEGSLTGQIRPDTSFPAEDWRHLYFAGDRKRQVWERVQHLCRDLGIRPEDLPAIALRFCLSSPVVSTVIPGMRSPRHVQANAGASDEGPLTPAALAIAHAHRWVRNFYPVN